MELVMKSKFSGISINYDNNYYPSDDKLSAERNTAFKNNAIENGLKVLNQDDPSKKIMSINERKTFILITKLISTQMYQM